MTNVFSKIAIGVFVLLWTGCSQKEIDKGIKEMIATTAKKEIAFAGVNYRVANGIVTLTGVCPAEKAREQVAQKVRGTNGVKDVVNLIQLAPVTLNGDFPLKQSVDSVLMKYPMAEGIVQDSVIIVQGEVESKAVDQLLKGLKSLNAKALNNQLVVK